MRVLFGVVVCIFVQSQVFEASAQSSFEPSTEISTDTDTATPSSTTSVWTTTGSCTGLDPPQNLTIEPQKTSATLIWSTTQTNQNCIPLNLTVDCLALWEENVEGWNWVAKNSTARSDVYNNITEIYVENLTEFTNYTCYATLLGIQGNTSVPKEIKFQTEMAVSGSPMNLTIVDMGSNNFTVQWEKPEKNPGIFTRYIIHIVNHGPNYSLPLNDCSPDLRDGWSETPAEEYVFIEAFPNYNYEFKVFMENYAGNGSKAAINLTTLTAAAEAPQNLNITNYSLNIEENEITVNISWDMPCYINGPIEYFNIELDGNYTLNTTIQDFRNFTEEATSAGHYSKEIKGLMPASNYTLRIQANGIDEEGYFSNYPLVTEDNLPGTPILEDTIDVGSTHFTILWAEPERRAGAIEKYEIWIVSLGPMYNIDWNRCSPNNSVFNFTTANETSFNFTHGLPYYRYNISVSAVTSKGSGELSTISAETEQSEPEKPEDLVFELLDGNDTGKVSWQTPCNLNGPLDKFFIKISGYYSEDSSVNPQDYNITVPYNQYTYAYNYSINLLESYKYEIILGSILQDGTHGLNDSRYLTTPDGYPGPPVNTLIGDIQNTSFAILWARPSLKNGRILQYQINVTSLGPAYETHCILNTTNYVNYTDGNTTDLIFTEGEPFYNYRILVQAETARGWGNATISYNITAQSVPENVENISNNVLLPTEETYNAIVNIRSQQPCRINGPLVNYGLRLVGTRENFPTHIVTLNNTYPSFDVNLKPEFGYEFAISTRNEKYINTTSSLYFWAPAGVPQFLPSINDTNIEAGISTATIVLNAKHFNDTNGKIIYVAIILSKTNKFGGEYAKWEKWPDANTSEYYQVTEDRWAPFIDGDVVTFTIGNGTNNCTQNSSPCNKPLQSDEDYYAIVRIFTDGFYKNSHAIHFRTEATSKLGIILGVIFGLFAVSLFGITGFLLWRNSNMKLLPPILYARKVSANKISTDGNTSVPINKFIQYCKNLENNPEKLTEQYALLTEKSKELMSTHTTSFAELTENRRKNRYTNILPYDATRVKLLIDEDDEIGSDYINASYIKGYSGIPEYIATQGPLPTTCRDFWKMVIQENVSIIVMVTQFVEDNKEKCYKYFPNNHESMTIGDDMEVHCTMELHFGTYCVRTLQVKKDSTQTTVTHMQYLDWPDFNVPKGTDTMLQFCYQLRERLKIEGGYVIVHCSAGVGRTGTLIATDILIQNINAGKNIDIFNTVLELRKQRMLMVQAQKQYVYIHNLIRDTLEQSRSLGLNDNLEPLYENQSALQLKADDDSLINKEKEKESQF